MSDYVYLPDYDGEWSVMSRSEYVDGVSVYLVGGA